MNKLLLGAMTALGVSAVVMPAFSQETTIADGRLKLGLRGYFTGGIAYTNVDKPSGSDADFEPVLFGSDSEIHAYGKTVLDSGLEIGVKAEFELERDSGDESFDNEKDFVDEVYLQISGGFGRVQFGQQDGAADQMIFSAPNVFSEFTISSIDMDPVESQYDYYATGQGIAAATVNGVALANKLANGTGNFRNLIDTSPDFSDDVTKLIYFTPRIAGLQIGVSYAPIYGKNGQGFQYNSTTNPIPVPLNILNDSYGNNFVEGAVNYIYEFGPDKAYRLMVSGSYGRGDGGGAADNPVEYHGGARAEFPGFRKGHKVTVGGAYKRANLSGAPFEVDDTEVMDAGITYETEQWTFGVAVASAEGPLDGREAALNAPIPDTTGFIVNPVGVYRDQQSIIGGITRKFGPGMEIGIGAMYYRDKSHTYNQTSGLLTIGTGPNAGAYASGDTIAQGEQIDAFAVFTEISVNF